MSLLSPATSSLLASASSPVGSGVPDIGISGYLINLVVILVVLVGMAYLMKRYGKGRILGMPVGLRGRDLKIEDRLPIDPQRALLVVSHGKRRWLVGMTQYAFNAVAELDPTADFEQALGQEMHK